MAIIAEPPVSVAAGRPSQHAPRKLKLFVKRLSDFRLGFAAKAALLAVLILAGTGLITLKLWGEFPAPASLRQKVTELLRHVPFVTADAKATAPARSELAPAPRQLPPTYPFAFPDTYGVYVVSDGQLTPLEPLPLRVPDPRVFMSNMISKPAPAPIPSGRVSFVVYHRDIATSVPETASVRVVAKVMQAITLSGGKPKTVAVEDTWSVRGGAFDLRIAPVAANHEMIMVRSADPNFTLSPGRYVLMFKNQAYDFVVAGAVNDTVHCLEQSDPQDRSVVTECRKLPTLAARL